MSIYLGLDLGCTGCKAIAVDDQGNTVNTASGRYDGTLIAKGGNAYDQDPAVLRDAGMQCLQDVLSGIDRNDVKAIGVTAQMHSMVVLDRDKKVIRPMISCVDARNDKQIQEIYEKCGGIENFLSMTNNRMVASCTGGKMIWMRENEPELFQRVRYVMTPKDYFRMQLTGEILTDESDASGFGLYDVKRRCWNKSLLELIEIPASILPEVRASNAFAGNILPEIAGELGIPGSTKVVAGGGDAVVQTAGAGAVSKGVYSIILGSGGNISASSDVFYENKKGNIQFYAASIPGMWVAYAGVMSVGNTTNWFREVFMQNQRDAFAELEKAAAAVDAGCNGLLFYPSMLGQRNPIEDTNAKGMFLGLDMEHHAGDMFRAVLEGIAMQMREIADTITPACGPMESVVLSGGGSCNDLWCQIFADIFQIPVQRAANSAYCGARGAAILGMGCGKDKPELQKLFGNNGKERTWEPDREKSAVYQELFEIYKHIYADNREAFARIKKFRDRYEK